MRYLPPLLVVLVLAVIAVRCAQEPSRAEARARITGLAQGGRLERARRELLDYEARYAESDDRWYAARMWFRLRDPARALDTIWGHAPTAAQPGTARRFAETGLLALGWDSEDRTEPTAMEPTVLIALVEGGNAWARERLAKYGRENELMAVTPYFFPAYRRASTTPLATLVEAFRTRGDEKYDVAAALGGLSTKDYPQRAADIAILRKVVASDVWRRQYRDVWLVANLALGRSEDPGAIEALQAAEAALAASGSERDEEDVHFPRIGLLAAGRFEVDEALARGVFGEAPNLHRTIWYLEALIHRYLSGDMRSELGLRQVWEGPGARYQPLRSRIARAFLLQDTVLDEEAVETFVGRMLRELEAEGSPVIGHVLARAWRLRRGEDGALEAMLQVLRTIARAFGTGEDADALQEPFVEALRALYRYG